MISVIHLDADASVEQAAATALAAFARRPGYLRGALARSTDHESAWLLITEWATVGAYRRALSHRELKLEAAPVWAAALDLPSAFEELLTINADGVSVVAASDREPTA
jgi:hypothetical protein